jgi:hypothetical protein
LIVQFQSRIYSVESVKSVAGRFNYEAATTRSCGRDS